MRLNWRATVVICAPFRVRKLDMPVGLRCYRCLVALWGQNSQKRVLTLEKESERKMEVTMTKIRTLNKVSLNFTVAPCINNIKHFIVQLMHTNYKILRLLKWLKL